MFATNVVFEPLIGELFRSGLVMQAAPGNGDFVTPTVMGAGESDYAQRDLRWTKACFGPLVHDREFADHNKQLMQGWLSAWVPRGLAAARTMQPLWSQPDHRPPRFEDSLDHAKNRFAGICHDLGLDDPEGAGPVTTTASARVRRRQRHVVRNCAGMTLMNDQVGEVIAEVMKDKPGVTITYLPSMIRVDGAERIDFVYDEFAEALGEEPGFVHRGRPRGEHVDPLRPDGPRGRPDDHVRQSRGRGRVPRLRPPPWPRRPAEPPARGRRPGACASGRRPVSAGACARPVPPAQKTDRPTHGPGGPHGQGTAIRCRCPTPAAGGRRAARRVGEERRSGPRAAT